MWTSFLPQNPKRNPMVSLFEQILVHNVNKYTELNLLQLMITMFAFSFLLVKPPVFGPSKQLDIELEMVITVFA